MQQLVHGQFPALNDRSPVHVGAGFDCDVWRFGDLAFRFPRRKFGVDALTIEARVLPALAPLLPVPIPAPTHFGEPTEAFPHRFVGHPYLEGLTGDRARLSPAQRLALAPQIAGFLRHLHGMDPDLAARIGVPKDSFRGDMAHRVRWIGSRLPLVEGTPLADRLPAVRALVDDAPPNADPLVPKVQHGDLYARHLLLDGDRRLCGVIDWGDVCVGDAAHDLGVSFALLPPEAREAFFAVYGPVDAATLRRSRLVALSHGLTLYVYGRDVGDADLIAEAEVIVDHALGA